MTISSPRTHKNYKPYETERMLSLDGAELASFLLRACAFCIDVVLALLLLLCLVVGIAIPMSEWLGVKNLNLEFGPHTWYALVYLALFFGLTSYFGKGRTLGKRLMGIRVVSLVHHRLSLFHSIERALGYAVSTGELFFGFFQYFIHPNRRTVHDRMAETIVIQDKRDKAANEIFERRLRLGVLVFGGCIFAAALGLYFFAPTGLFKGAKVQTHFGGPNAHQ